MQRIITSLFLLTAFILNAQQAIEVGPGRPPKGWNKYRQTLTDKKLKMLKRQSVRFNAKSNTFSVRLSETGRVIAPSESLSLTVDQNSEIVVLQIKQAIKNN